MGTRGYRIFRFRGRYWIFYNDCESYPHGMGNSLVEHIPNDPEEYQKWLESQGAFYAKWDSLLQKLLCVTPENLLQLESDETRVNVWQAAFDERMESGTPTYYPRYTDMNIEYTYTIDLDLQVFSTDNSAHYRLNHIPRNQEWIGAMFQDGAGHRFVLPQYVPKESVASLTVEVEDFSPNASDYWKELKTRELDDLSITLLGWTAQDLPFREIAFFILCLAAGGDHFALEDERRVIKPPDPEHDSKHLYAAIVEGRDPKGGRELISPVGVGYHMQGLPMGSAPSDSKYWFEGALVCLVPRLNRPGVLEKAVADTIQYGRIHCACNSFHALLISIENVVLIKSYDDGTVDHTAALPLFSIDCHLSMNAWERYDDINKFYDDEIAKSRQAEAENPDQPGHDQAKVNGQDGSHIQAAEGLASKGATEQDGEELNNKAKKEIVRGEGQGQEGMVRGEGEESHDKAKKEIADSEGQGQEGMVQGEGEEWEQRVKNVDELRGDEEGIEVKEETVEGRGGEDNEENEKKKSDPAEHAEDIGNDNTVQSVWTVEDTFKSLVQFFEAIVHETLKPTSSEGEDLPIEIYEMILGNVTDTKTHNACMKVSRKFRSLCHQRPLIMDNLVFLEPLLSHPKSGQELEETKKVQIKPEFRVVECSSSRHMDVSIHRGKGRVVSLDCRMVIGSEENRKSFPTDCPITILGLDVSAPWDDVEQLSHESNRFRTHRIRPERTDTVWDSALSHGPFTIESSTRELDDFWSRALRGVYGFIDYARFEAEPSQAWELPPNTSQLCASSDPYRHEEVFHYLFVRIKRASKYWDNLWEDIFREATDYLAAPDKCDAMETIKRSGKQAVGADEPYVMLTVGLEVRLFKWEHGFPESVPGESRKGTSPISKLKELQPGKVYLITKAEDREVFEKFFMTAVEKLQGAKEKEKAGYPPR